MSEEARREVWKMVLDFATAMHCEDDGELLTTTEAHMCRDCGHVDYVTGDFGCSACDAIYVGGHDSRQMQPVTVTVRRRKA
jgi:ribosomal protein L37E